jgi:hypothetical protein
LEAKEEVAEGGGGDEQAMNLVDHRSRWRSL